MTDNEELIIVKGTEHPEEFTKPPIDKELSKALEKIARICNHTHSKDGYSVDWEDLKEYEKAVFLNDAYQILSLLDNYYGKLYNKKYGKEMPSMQKDKTS